MDLTVDLARYFEARAHKEFGGSWQADIKKMRLYQDNRTLKIIRKKDERGDYTTSNAVLEEL